MTLDQVRSEIEFMRSNSHDPELQHSIRDELYHRVLTEIAERRYNDAWDLAATALEAEKVTGRWRACG